MPEKKVIVITGASSGIGRALMQEAASRGWAVVAVSREQAELEREYAHIVREGGTCIALPLDVTEADAPSRIVAASRQRFGRIDVIVHCAGAAIGGIPLLEQSDAQIDGQWSLHVAAPLRITREAYDLLKATRGQVFFVGSGLRRVPAPYYGAYCAAKAAVETLAMQLRRELSGSGITVTFVDPGSVRTRFAETAGIPPYGPVWASVKPELVARRIMDAIKKRPMRLLAVPWHTLGAVLGEWFPRIADLSVTPPITPKSAADGVVEQPVAPEVPEPAHAPAAVPSAFEAALAPVARRMERVKLAPEFLADLLRPGGDVHLQDAAMRWAGMPNKNERAAMQEALDALTDGGFLERTGEESWRVVRSPN